MGGFLHRLGAFTARHAVIVLIVWAILAVGMVGLVKTYGAKTNNNLSLPGTDSQQAFDILAARFPPQENSTNPFVFHVDRGKLTDPANAAALDATYAAIKRSPHVYSVMNPVGKKGKAAGLLSKDGRTGFMPVLLDINSGFITVRLAEAALEATAPAQTAGIRVAVGGSIGSALSAPETKTSEVLGNIAAMVVLALVFGSLVAMGTPIVNGDPTVKQFGVGLAVAVLLAGTMVVLLAPAILTLFRGGLFWLPRFLDRILPHLDIEGGAEVPPEGTEEEPT
jgi:RND superfamily putative drug exporter